MIELIVIAVIVIVGILATAWWDVWMRRQECEDGGATDRDGMADD